MILHLLKESRGVFAPRSCKVFVVGFHVAWTCYLITFAYDDGLHVAPVCVGQSIVLNEMQSIYPRFPTGPRLNQHALWHSSSLWPLYMCSSPSCKPTGIQNSIRKQKKSIQKTQNHASCAVPNQTTQTKPKYIHQHATVTKVQNNREHEPGKVASRVHLPCAHTPHELVERTRPEAQIGRRWGQGGICNDDMADMHACIGGGVERHGS